MQIYTPWSVTLHQIYTKFTLQYFKITTTHAFLIWKHVLFLNNIFFQNTWFFQKICPCSKNIQKKSNHCIFSDNIKHILPGRDFSFLCQGNWWLESPQSCNTIGTIISIRYIWNLQRHKWLINCGLDCMIFCKIDSERLL